MIRTTILLAAVLLSSQAFATVNTLSLVDEYTDGSSKVCIYSDGNRTESVVKEGAGECPSKKTFH
ncbi:hypothetical protein GAP31_158 [Cronobacter phage vB_CsaM_GAP31]|uniref:Putative membrane protein n=1 Tax=Cronobacter phage vB_CsaM_GAP31 TaxID=1141135 RepID=K4FAX2_9CAUD|nr:hypothetical protein GAP31_158 [Cronobacter phage vB_CsaM_GAP31]AFC21339.1 putative membrane protein [Cronobacter phage vB_CsaM_GAP31]